MSHCKPNSLSTIHVFSASLSSSSDIVCRVDSGSLLQIEDTDGTLINNLPMFWVPAQCVQINNWRLQKWANNYIQEMALSCHAMPTNTYRQANHKYNYCLHSSSLQQPFTTIQQSMYFKITKPTWALSFFADSPFIYAFQSFPFSHNLNYLSNKNSKLIMNLKWCTCIKASR